jgi:hypothetical protein
MGNSLNYAEGFRMLLDGQQRFVASAKQVFLRLQNFQNSGPYLEVGVPFAPTGTALAQSGFTDLLIDPPPEMRDISMHNIGLLAGRLNFGDKTMTVSHTFVLNIMQQYPAILDSYDVWRNWDGNTPVVGIVYQNRMWAIESITNFQLAGETISWKLILKGLEQQLEPASQELVEP